MRSRAEYDAARKLLAAGLSINAVARATGVPRSTVGYWRRTPTRRGHRTCPIPERWRPPDQPSYSYLLGLYLGDGCVFRTRRSVVLRLYLDEAYPGVVNAAADAIPRVFPNAVVRRYRRDGMTIVHAAHQGWTTAFPQHGPGKKHLRPIRLEPWQREITGAHPRDLIRGLIHSDGCRSINRFRTTLPSGRVAQYAYARYFFSNLSDDIKDVFCDHCDLLGIAWSRANPRYVSIHDRSSVAVLDSFVGPKG